MKAAVTAVGVLLLAGIGGCSTVVFIAAGGQDDPAATCTPVTTLAATVPAVIPAGNAGPAASAQLPPRIGSYSGEQVTNAAAVVQAARDLGLDARGQAVGVMTAIGESTLRNIDYGDFETRGVRNGDGSPTTSVGLFQQQGNGAWGSLADRMDPRTAATNFYRALVEVEGWESMPPTLAAHATQRNADPWHYEPFWDDAVQIVSVLSGNPDLAASLPATAAEACIPGAEVVAAADVTAGGWTAPSAGPWTSGYGMRVDPVSGAFTKLHGGIDLAPDCGAPIVAAAAGVVTQAGPAGSYGNLVVLDHSSGQGDLETYYAHMYSPDVLVDVGQTVTAGEQIARVGSAGNSTGCHLHFEVQIDGDRTDPAPYLTDRGIDIGPLT